MKRTGPVRVSEGRACELLRFPVITEKSTMASEHNQVTFRVPLDATKPEIKAAVERLFDVKVTAVNTIRQRGEGEALPRPYRKAAGLQEGHGLARRRPVDRRDDRGLGDGAEEVQSDHVLAAGTDPRRPLGALEGASGQETD